ncbi:hypothetical protein [Bacillus sp. ISL-46]|uniref:hypothetical protein n=1 Tax=Bacillus sp. ISL-46 TaxID=2819129 RepID=UPI001BE8F109|nr:hypothetical protein [Bacillus sp. ISL-46]MBT2721420.1 hypothetical protein [Bacillus sp. ISL-46]
MIEKSSRTENENEDPKKVRKKPGRPFKEYEDEEIEKIIKLYLKINESITIIKPYSVYQFSKELYESGKIKQEFKQSFWRNDTQLGRKLINKWNEILKKSKEKPIDDNKGFYNTESLLARYSETLPKGVIKKLKLNEEKGKRFALKSEKKEMECEALKKQIATLENELQKKVDEQEILEQTLFNVTLASSQKRSKMENLMDVSGERSAMVEEILKYGFSEVDSGMFKAWMTGMDKARAQKEKAKLIKFEEKKRTSAFDDFTF